jgi:hypothetical protein
MKVTSIYIAIETKYLPETTHRGMRIKATVMETFNGRKISVTVPWDHADGTAAQHEKAAYKLLPAVVNDPKNVTLIGGRYDQGYIWVVHRE